MNLSYRIFRKDLFELLHNKQAIVLVFILPPILLLAAGQLRVNQPKINLLLFGSEKCQVENRQKASECRIINLIKEIAYLELNFSSSISGDPHSLLTAGDSDLLLDISEDDPLKWQMYTTVTNPEIFARVNKIADHIKLGIETISISPKVISNSKKILEKTEVGIELRNRNTKLYSDLKAIGVISGNSTFTYFPQSGETAIAILPRMIGLLICFLPFFLASTTIIRERDLHTLEILMCIPKVNPVILCIGKCILPLLITMFNFLLILVLSETVYGIHVKGGIIYIVFMLVPAILSSIFLGLLASTTAKSPEQAIVMGGLYFLCLCLVSGFLSPISESSNIIQHLSQFSPLSLLIPTLDRWMFGADIKNLLDEGIGRQLIQMSFYGVLALFFFHRRLRRIF